ncbi:MULTISPECIES: MerR family transcriptional regulator [Oerskovia]|uniref:MerR family transcriptional regulator n=2 Tax=Oerskovia TaxID=162491 RepID=A0ABR8V439_9CELL|nr:MULTISPECIES: MerR family transcriptional regulator [Oerskovia]MBD7999450.1 MerR family transcriptional regulator [Oerskovia gallyi]MBM7495369.1 DNA-binding transcriptional MerR regulator [Oerskovia paurometabola]
MRIGELSRRTGTATRLLRYYEEQGLLTPQREENGYREYGEHLVDRVLQIRGLLEVGFPTRIIAELLPCLNQPREIHLHNAYPDKIALLETELGRMTERIDTLTRNRDAIADYLERIRADAAPAAALAEK